MAEVFGALAQVAPTGGVLTTAYTVPADKRATVEVVICNRSGSAVSVRLSHAAAGAADATKQYLLYDFGIDANASVTTSRFTANATDVVRVYASSSDVSFNVNGIEE